ncbi:Uncharacterized protein APZ42_018721 [Daphnia magna]|uniref:Uncharacterized protein n=1 Tax=Daphnia magna TaxID=35525 RepID=A0A0P5KYT3_9CRUS|nr:Uncharacterized protein APZ42_018721 [Daphnia magna]
MALVHGHFKYITLARPFRYVRKNERYKNSLFFLFFYREKMLTRSVCHHNAYYIYLQNDG